MTATHPSRRIPSADRIIPTSVELEDTQTPRTLPCLESRLLVQSAQLAERTVRRPIMSYPFMNRLRPLLQADNAAACVVRKLTSTCKFLRGTHFPFKRPSPEALAPPNATRSSSLMVASFMCNAGIDLLGEFCTLFNLASVNGATQSKWAFIGDPNWLFRRTEGNDADRRSEHFSITRLCPDAVWPRGTDRSEKPAAHHPHTCTLQLRPRR